jgi:NhaP-type Na+/H+ or K+/H+ antiporter
VVGPSHTIALMKDASPSSCWSSWSARWSHRARRIHVPWPVLLVLAGLELTRVPAFSHVKITPELVLTVFLPPLLFRAAWEGQSRPFKRYRGPILLLSVGLVISTTAVVAFVGVAVIPRAILGSVLTTERRGHRLRERGMIGGGTDGLTC